MFGVTDLKSESCESRYSLTAIDTSLFEFSRFVFVVLYAREMRQKTKQKKTTKTYKHKKRYLNIQTYKHTNKLFKFNVIF